MSTTCRRQKDISLRRDGGSEDFFSNLSFPAVFSEAESSRAFWGEIILIHDVSSDAKSSPFIWTPYPTAQLNNRHGLLAAPFRVAVRKPPTDSHR